MRRRKGTGWKPLWLYNSYALCLGISAATYVLSSYAYADRHYTDSVYVPTERDIIINEIVTQSTSYALFLMPFALFFLVMHYKILRKNENNLVSFLFNTTGQWIILSLGLILSAINYYLEHQPYFSP